MANDDSNIGDIGNSQTEGDGSSRGHGPLSILFPPDLDVWHEARRLVADKNLRVEDLATCASQDPVLVLDLLKVSNAMYFSGGKSAICSARTAIVRLGSDVVVEILEKMKDRSQLDDEDIRHWFELHRSRCKRTAIIARIMSEAVARTLCDDCQTAALFMFIGEMLAVAHLREVYVGLAEELSRSGIIYRLGQEYKFDVETMGLAYLRRYGIPELVLFAIDREARVRSHDRAVMKPLCMAAAEMVDAFDMNRWERLAPGKTLPPKSALRSLQISDNQYLKIYERCSEYLFSTRLLEERRKQQAGVEGAAYVVPELAASPHSQETDELQSEIQNLVKSTLEEDLAIPQQESQISEAGPSAPPEPKLDPAEVIDQQFSLREARKRRKNKARKRPEEVPPQAPPQAATERAQTMLLTLSSLFEQVSTSEDLLSDLLATLVDKGPFEKSALIVVSEDRSKAIVVAARGPGIENRQVLSLDNPLSPLAQCFSKIQSFGTREHECSPFGSRSFALAPIDADHETPVALYADCGNNGAVPFEARRIFRLVVEVLNQKLPQIAGGIPVEI